jgi:alpha-2-macroglobulin
MRAGRTAGLCRALLGLGALVLAACAHTRGPRSLPPRPDGHVLELFDPARQAEGAPPGGVVHGSLTIRDVRPQGPGDGAGIRLRLDRAVVDPNAPPPGVQLVLERETGSGDWIAVASHSRWTRGDTLEATPAAPLPDATAFRVRLTGRIEHAGVAIEGTQWSFETARPSLVLEDPYQAIGSTDGVWVVPSLPTDPAQLAAHISALARPTVIDHEDAGARVPASAPATVVPVRVRRATAADSDYGLLTDALLVLPVRRWPAGTTVELRVEPQLHSRAGPLPLVEGWQAHFDVRPRFAVGGLACRERSGERCPLGPVAITTTVAVASDELERIRVEPPLAELTIDDGSDELGRPAVLIDGAWVAKRRYQVVFPAGLRDRDDGRLARGKRVPVRITDVPAAGEATLALSDSRGIFDAPARARIGVLSERVEAVRVRIATLRATDAVELVLADDLAVLPWPDTDRDVTVVLHPNRRGPARGGLAVELGAHARAGDVVLVEASAVDLAARTHGRSPPAVRGLYRISALGVVAHAGLRAGFTRVTGQIDGAPRANATVTIVRKGEKRARATTDAHGLAPLGATDLRGTPTAILVDDGDDALVLTLRPHPWLRAEDHRRARMTSSGRLASWPRVRPDDAALPEGLRPGELAALVIHSGRGIYMPGDAIDIAGWAGISTPHELLTTRRVETGTPVELELRHGDDVIVRSRAVVDEHGRFVARMRVPKSSALGDHTVVARMLGGVGTISFAIAEPRIPAFELLATPRAHDLLRGAPIVVDATARYLAGAPAPIESARAEIVCHPSGPPMMRALPEGFDASSNAEVGVWSRSPELDAAGGAELELVVPTDALDHRRPMACSIAIAAADRRLQEIGADTFVQVHPAAVYLALRRIDELRAGATPTLELIAVDHSGERTALAKLEITLSRIERDPLGERAPLVRCTRAVAATGRPARCTAPALRSGRYRVRATATADGAPIAIEQDLWVSEPPPRSHRAAAVLVAAPAATVPPPIPFAIEVESQTEAGVATPVTIRGPWPRAHGVLAVEHLGLREAIPFELDRGVARLEVTPRRGRSPTLELVARVTPPADPDHEHVALAELSVIDPRELQVQLRTVGHTRPGQRVTIEARVTDSRGAPVDARIALWVIDDGLTLLRHAGLPWFERSFHPDRRGERSVTRSYDELLHPYWPWTRRWRTRSPAVRMAAGQVSGALDPTISRRFDPAPLFVGNLGTGPDGELEIPLQLPDDATRFRITAIASATLDGAPESGPARFGHDETMLLVRNPLELRAALPRVLRPGDRASLGVLVTAPRAGQIAVQLELVDRKLAVHGVSRRIVELAAPGTTRVDFEIDARAVGTATLRLRAQMPGRVAAGTLHAAVEHQLPIEIERTNVEVAARYGSIAGDEAIAVPVRLPARALPGSGAVAITSSSTLVGELQDAASYLEDYPYGCLEQTASRLVPIIALGSLGARTGEQAQLTVGAAEAIARIASMQLPSGELAYWPDSAAPAGFAGGYALWVLQLAVDRGLTVPTSLLTRARAAMLARLDDPISATEPARELVERSMLLHALAAGGAIDARAFDRMLAHRGSLPPFARLLLTLALHRVAPDDPRMGELRNQLSALIEEREGVAHVVEPAVRHRELFDSGVRDDALALIALLALAPTDPRIEKLARGLRDRRSAGRWRTTQENAFALLALADYAAAHEPEPPEHRIRAWIGARPVLYAEVHGTRAASHSASLDLDAAIAGADGSRTTSVLLQRTGRGRAFYRIGVQWAQADAPARAQGLRLQRRLLDEHGTEVSRLVAGRRYLLELELETDAVQSFIAVDAPLPAGLEGIDLSLGAGMRARARIGTQSPEVSHLELRRDRVLVFFDELPAGKHVHTVPVLATTPGSFALPGAIAEAMYEPETRARTTSARLEITAPGALSRASARAARPRRDR